MGGLIGAVAGVAAAIVIAISVMREALSKV